MKPTNKEQSTLLHHWTRLKTINNILYRESGENEQLILPSKMHRLIYEELHIKVGHAGPERVYQLAKERMFWPGMEKDTFFNKNLQLC